MHFCNRGNGALRKPFFIQKRNAEDEFSFRKLCLDSDVNQYLTNPENIRLLWNICCIPDFQKIINDNHIALLKNIFLNLIKNDFFLPEDWIFNNVSKLEDYRGEIDELSNKIANIRTWTYISNQSNWLINQRYWQDKTRIIEDNLSDKLHEELTKSFIDKRASVLVKGLKQDIVLETKIIDEEKVMINHQYIGSLKGLKLELDLKVDTLDADIKSLKKAARQNVSPEIIKRIFIKFYFVLHMLFKQGN